jgi:hypothetical protein
VKHKQHFEERKEKKDSSYFSEELKREAKDYTGLEWKECYKWYHLKEHPRPKVETGTNPKGRPKVKKQEQ